MSGTAAQINLKREDPMAVILLNLYEVDRRSQPNEQIISGEARGPGSRGVPALGIATPKPPIVREGPEQEPLSSWNPLPLSPSQRGVEGGGGPGQ